jgi:ribonucleoside-triphosphate reductase (thioredoxin)
MNEYGSFVHKSRYARYRDDLGRRETWPETVKRYCDFWQEKYPADFPYDKIYGAIVDLNVMPSMRALMSAGPALARDNMAGYNCSYVAINNVRCFDEIMYVLLCGTGVGFSVERQYCQQLPEIPEELHESNTTISVADSKIGWAAAFRELLSLLYSGQVPKWDLSKVRPAGSRLKTFGGRASGPEPLDNLFHFTIQLFKKSIGAKLSSLQVHDLVCKVADVVVVGGVRRSALISLSNLTDERLRSAKSGAWSEHDPQRALANNSVAYTEKPDIGIFMKEWHSLYESKSGERGIFNRVSARVKSEANGRRDSNHEFGTNPCGEIILRPNGLCNLSEVVVRSTDEFGDLKSKVEIATIIGTFQSTLTDFRYVRPIWKRNAEEERLLGVSFTGIMDHPLFSGSITTDTNVLSVILKELRDHAIETNKEWSGKLGINPSVAITTVKPSGTVSQLVDSASGIHPRHSQFYLRTVRADKKDPLAMFMRKVGFPVEDDLRKPEHTDVFSFPVKAPPGSVFRNDRSAIQQLQHYLTFKDCWCEHNPSITVYVKEEEWIEVEAWVYKHFNEIGGIAFLPYDGGQYKQAPYQDLTEEEYMEWVKKMPQDVSWEDFKEHEDHTTASQELACVGGSCEIN